MDTSWVVIPARSRHAVFSLSGGFYHLSFARKGMNLTLLQDCPF